MNEKEMIKTLKTMAKLHKAAEEKSDTIKVVGDNRFGLPKATGRDVYQGLTKAGCKYFSFDGNNFLVKTLKQVAAIHKDTVFEFQILPHVDFMTDNGSTGRYHASVGKNATLLKVTYGRSYCRLIEQGEQDTDDVKPLKIGRDETPEETRKTAVSISGITYKNGMVILASEFRKAVKGMKGYDSVAFNFDTSRSIPVDTIRELLKGSVAISITFNDSNQAILVAMNAKTAKNDDLETIYKTAVVWTEFVASRNVEVGSQVAIKRKAVELAKSLVSYDPEDALQLREDYWVLDGHDYVGKVWIEDSNSIVYFRNSPDTGKTMPFTGYIKELPSNHMLIYIQNEDGSESVQIRDLAYFLESHTERLQNKTYPVDECTHENKYRKQVHHVVICGKCGTRLDEDGLNIQVPLLPAHALTAITKNNDNNETYPKNTFDDGSKKVILPESKATAVSENDDLLAAWEEKERENAFLTHLLAKETIVPKITYLDGAEMARRFFGKRPYMTPKEMYQAALAIKKGWGDGEVEIRPGLRIKKGERAKFLKTAVRLIKIAMLAERLFTKKQALPVVI